MPSESEFLSRIGSKRKLGKVPVLQATEAELEAAGKRADAPAPAVSTTPASAPPDAAATALYPPLESPVR